jgi:transposase
VPSPKLVPLLSDAERESLEALVRKLTASQSLALRARVVLACAGKSGTVSQTVVTVRTGVSRESVRKWRVRFMERRLDGLADVPRPGAPRKITDEQLEVLVTRTLTERGHGQDTQWSTRTMAAETGLSQSSVSRIWRTFGLKPHVLETNYATCKTPAIKDWLIKHPRFHLHFTPASSSWLNLVGRWFAELTNRKLRRSAHRSVTELEAGIRKWVNEWNNDPKQPGRARQRIPRASSKPGAPRLRDFGAWLRIESRFWAGLRITSRDEHGSPRDTAAAYDPGAR